MAKPSQIPRNTDTLAKLQEQLTCAKCLNAYTNPKVLDCFHVFCGKCLVRLSGQTQSLLCPTCRQPTTLPQNGVAGLQEAIHIHRLFEIRHVLQKLSNPLSLSCEKCKKRQACNFCRNCGQFICSRCSDVHRTWEELSTHKVVTIQKFERNIGDYFPQKREAAMCSKHPARELDLYCETCEKLVCRDCIVRVHQDHQYDLISDAFPKHKDAILAALQPLKQLQQANEQALAEMEAQRAHLVKQQEGLEASIQHAFAHLQKALEERKAVLTSQLHKLMDKKLGATSGRKKSVELLQARLTSCSGFVEQILQAGCEAEFLAMKQSVLKKIHSIEASASPSSKGTLEDDEGEVYFEAKGFSELTNQCKGLGHIYCHPVCPEKCYASGKGLEVAEIGEPSVATLHAVDHRGKECDVLIEGAECQLVSYVGSTIKRGQVERLGGNQYQVKYIAVKRGKHHLRIRVKNTHISGSPFTVFARMPMHRLGTSMGAFDGLSRPWGVAVGRKGQVVVTEASKHCVSIFTSRGKKIRTFGEQGSGRGQLYYPRGVAVDEEGSVLVADGSNDRIQKYTTEGLLLSVIGQEGSKPLQFNSPVGIAINKKNRMIYVCDESNHRVQILTPNLKFSSMFGSEGSGPGEFKFPMSIAFDSAGAAYVTDRLNHRVQVFSMEGKYLREFGGEGVRDGELTSPVGIGISDDGLVYVTEWLHRVSVFTCDGQFLKSFGKEGADLGQLKEPCCVAVDEDGITYIAENLNGRVQCF